MKKQIMSPPTFVVLCFQNQFLSKNPGRMPGDSEEPCYRERVLTAVIQPEWAQEATGRYVIGDFLFINFKVSWTWWWRPIISAAWETAAGGLQVQGLCELEIKCNACLNNLVRTSLKVNTVEKLDVTVNGSFCSTWENP